MSQWMQCSFIQTSPTWADSVCSLHPDTHDGFDDTEVRKRIKKQVREDEREFRSKRDRLRNIIARAFEPERGPVAEDVKAAAAPYVERLESGAQRIDYAALERNQAVMDELLAFQDSLRTEFRNRMAIANDDEDVMILASQWS